MSAVRVVRYLQFTAEQAVPVAGDEATVQRWQVLIGTSQPLRTGGVWLLSYRVRYKALVVASRSQFLHGCPVVKLAKLCTDKSLSPSLCEDSVAVRVG